MYYQDVDYNNYENMFNFLSNHTTYYTMNSWNKLESIANNVKVYNIPDLDSAKALKALEEDDYLSVNQAIEDWNADHPGYQVGFNGRSGGYLVLYSTSHNRHCFKDDLTYPGLYNSYEEWKEDVEICHGSLEEYKPLLLEEVKLVQEFDKLCDDLVTITKSLIEDMDKREALTRKYSATLRFQRYYYDTIEDLKLHMLDMKRRGYSVYEFSKEDLYAEYEMNESIDSEIVLEKEGEEDFVYETE